MQLVNPPVEGNRLNLIMNNKLRFVYLNADLALFCNLFQYST